MKNSVGVSAHTILGDGYGSGGMCVDTVEDLSYLVTNLGLTKICCNYENTQVTGSTLDLSGSNVTSINHLDRLKSNMTIILPDCLEYFYAEAISGDFSCGSNRLSVKLPVKYGQSGTMPNFTLTNKNLNEVVVTKLGTTGQTFDSSWKDVTIDELYYNNMNFVAFDSSKYGVNSNGNLLNNSLSTITGVNFTSKVGILYLNNIKYNSLSELDKFTTTTEIYSWSNGLSRIGDYLEKNKVITKLYLTNNKITVLDGIENGINLEYLDLSNNNIRNTYTSETGENNTTAEVLASLPNLKQVDLSGNEITDFKGLERAGFKNDGNNVFTRP